MKFTVVTALLLAGTVIAAPHSAKRAERRAKRAAARALQGSTLKHIDSINKSNDSFVEYDSNWAGAVIIGTGYTTVTGTFNVPSPTGSGSGAAWVGIDGDTCQSAILQTGIDWTVSGGETTYDAWYEWYPDYSYDFSGSIGLAAGDQIKATVHATSKTGGTATLENLNTGESVSHTFSNEGSEGSLCETNAEWIVEDFEEGDSLVAFDNFGTITFTGCSATGSKGTVGTTGATIFDIESSSGKVLTACSVPSSSEVVCSYV